MTLAVEKTVRAFQYNGMALQDPDPKLTPEAVRDFYAANLYPEIVSAAIEGPTQKGNKLTYEFRKAVGTKGATKNNPGAYDCYDKADPDEPMFVLLARDKHAPALVWLWSVLREIDSEKPEIVAEARKSCVEMMAWAHDHDRKSVGLAQGILAGVFELIRTVNAGQKDKTNDQTDIEVIRRFLCESQFEDVKRAD
jgi:PRTRC genetic system protein C